MDDFPETRRDDSKKYFTSHDILSGSLNVSKSYYLLPDRHYTLHFSN
jgi:hypothetical protein